MKCFALLLLLPGPSLAFQLPFKVPFFFKTPVEDPLPTIPRIAIIGAGAGGSSAAFWISKAKERFGVDVEVDVYERESYIGGRSTVVYPYENSSLPPVELGASIFVKANKNLWRASDEFNLTRRDFDEEEDDMGIWDGEQLLLSFKGGWWDSLRMLWRYGILSPRRANSIVANMIKKFLTLYSAETPRWDDIANLSASLGWTDLTEQTTAEYFEGQGVSKQYTHELLEAATRVNYGQNVDEIHALEGACSMAATGASGIQGGNFQIFEQFLNRSGANVYLDTAVNSITQKPSSHRWTIRSTRGDVDYHAVILAAPFHSTGIKFPPSLSSEVPKQPYMHLHVTLITTTSPSLDPAFFSMPPTSAVPHMLLTTYEGARQGGKEPEFNSISYHGQIRDGEWVVKIFSKERVEDDWIDKVFGGKVGWIHRKEWDAYPKLPPTASFPPVKLDRGFYYVNAFEPFISTMETETIASRNVVDLLLNDVFQASICGPRISATTPEEASQQDDFVFGWDC